MYVHVRLKDKCLKGFVCILILHACTECSSANADKEGPQPAAGRWDAKYMTRVPILNGYTYIYQYHIHMYI